MTNPSPAPLQAAPEFVTIGAVTRDYQIAADGTLLFDPTGPGVQGGGGSYAMVGAWLWNSHVGLVGRYTDSFPAEWIDRIVRAGIDIQGLHLVTDVPAELVFGRYFPDGEREVYNPVAALEERGLVPSSEMRAWVDLGFEGQTNVIRQLSPTLQDIPPSYLRARGFHIGPMPYREHLKLVETLRPYNMLLTLDPGPHYMGSVTAQELTDLLTGVKVFMPSESEVVSYFGADKDLADCARRLTDLGPEIAVVKIGTRGSIVYERATGTLSLIPIFPAHTVDATGAGDSYCGGFMVGLVETGSARRAGMYGAVSASFIVQAPGSLHVLDSDSREVRARLAYIEQKVAP